MAAARTVSTYYAVFIATLVGSVYSTSIRGVATEKLSFYNPDREFTCLDGTVTVPFSYVNDDYCDCPDGSDEPGTSACPNGLFTCQNIGHKQMLIQSGRVNDGVCDCCDGSDEYDSDATCQNICQEEGKAERERLEQEKNVAQQGHQVKIGYIEQGQEKRLEIETKNKDLKTRLEEHRTKLDELKAAKERAESLEKEAKEKQDQEWEELKKQREEEKESRRIDEAFKKLDADGNGLLTIQELSTSVLITKDITDDEAREVLGGVDFIDRLQLHDMWSSIKDIYNDADPQKEDSTEKPAEVPIMKQESDKEKESESTADKGTDFPEPDNDADDDDDGDDADGDATEPASPEKTSQPATDDKADKDSEKPEYNEETKRLISIADQARKEFNEMETQVRNTENDVSNNDKILGIDFGAHQEFLALHGKCFEYTDREYVYKLCPFDSAMQNPKNGASGTSLGNWGEWIGHPNKYSEMKYKDGQACWNGPNRSTDVKLSCGAKNEIVSVSEPNRCEYVMDFKTPALCEDPAHLSHMSHEEL